MNELINKFRNLDQKAKIAIGVGLGLVIAAVVALGVIDVRQKQIIVGEIVAASAEYQTPAKDPLNAPLRSIFGDSDSSSGLYLGNSDVEVVATDGDYLALRAVTLDLMNYGSQYYAIYRQVDGQYQAVAAGSVISRDEYSDSPEGQAIPTGIFDAIERHTARRSDGKLQEILAKSPDKTYPIIDSLPITSDFYKISYAFEDQTDINSFYIYIDALTGYNNAALNNLVNAGYDPGDYRIVFNYDLVNKFM